MLNLAAKESGAANQSKKYQGLYFEVSYQYKDIPMKKMQFIIVTPDNRTAYSWGLYDDRRALRQGFTHRTSDV